MIKKEDTNAGLNERDHRTLRLSGMKFIMIVWILLSGAGILPSQSWGLDTTIIPAGSAWKYMDNGSDQGSVWRGPLFDDSLWPSGLAQLGYGDGDEATVLNFGPDPNNKFITTYFRRSFNVADPAVFRNLTLRLLRDDGAVVYLNGTEIFRTYMPEGTIAYNTLSYGVVFGSDENVFTIFCINPALLAAGTNVLAVEVHQNSGSSSDISFDLELIGQTDFDSASVTRGPYLQTGTPTGVTVRWRTDLCSDSRVLYGGSPGMLTAALDSTAITTEHEVMLSSLVPDTRYFYAVGTTSGHIMAGNDSGHFFMTAPLPGSTKPTRVWIIGDSGTASASAQAVRDDYLGFTGTRNTDVWLMLGDNAYLYGLDSEYQAAMFDMYPMLLRSTVVWPTFGNHDALVAASSTQLGPYYDIFTLPKSAEAGGVPSGTEAYYSFDYANIHFISLDSQDSDRSPTGPMLTWLQNDLAATTQEWIIALWHHPPYSKGFHDSDLEQQLIEMRQNVLPILEARGVDLVLSGHSHSYERSFLVDGFYGTPTLITDGNIIDGGSGTVGGDGAYVKPDIAGGFSKGTVYAVVGSSGQTDGVLSSHPLMSVSLNALGSMVLDIEGNRLNARFVDGSGAVLDRFTILKGVPVPDIKANGSDGPVTIKKGTLLNVTVSFEDGRYKGINADWFVVVNTPFGLFSYNPYSPQWYFGIVTTYQGPLVDLPLSQVLNVTTLPSGSYTFHFAVDMKMNGLVDIYDLYYDSVEVTITP